MEAYDFKATSAEHLMVYLSYGLDTAVPYEFASSSQILPDAYDTSPEGNQARYDGSFDFGPATQLAHRLQVLRHVEGAPLSAPEKLTLLRTLKPATLHRNNSGHRCCSHREGRPSRGARSASR